MAAAGALALVHLAWLLAHFAPAIMSADANGYVVQARLIATEGHTWFATESPAQFVGMHWLEASPGVFHSRYPAGLPMLMAAAWKIGGLTGALLINPLLASATVLLVFFLARPLAGHACALIAAAVVAAIPVTNHHALDADAHIAAAFFLVASVLALRRFANAPKIAWGLAAGVCLAIVPTIRYPEAVAVLAAAAWLAWRVRPLWRAWPVVAGAAIPLGVLLAHNRAAYGALWRTGYALTNEQTGFGLGHFLDHAAPYVLSLCAQGPVLYFAFGVAGLAALVIDRRRRPDGVLFAGIVVPLVMVYMAYYWGGPGAGTSAIGGNMRFFIPTFPFFATAGAWLLYRLSQHLGDSGRAAVGVVAALQLLVTGPTSEQVLERSEGTRSSAARARALAETQVPRGSVLILDYPMDESLDAVGRWRIVEESLVAGTGGRDGPSKGGRPPGPGGGPADVEDNRPRPRQVGKNRGQLEHYAGLSPSARAQRAWADLAGWAGGRAIYWLTHSPDALENTLPAGAASERVAEVDAPAIGFRVAGANASAKLRLVRITLPRR